MEQLKEIEGPNLTLADGSTLKDVEQEKRDEMLTHIQEQRKDRDDKLKEASSFKTKMKDFFGGTEGSSLTHQAKRIEEDLYSQNEWKHRQLQQELREKTTAAVQETIKDPLSEVSKFYREKRAIQHQAWMKREPVDELSLKIAQEKVEQSFSQENVRRAFADKRLRLDLVYTFDEFFDQQSNTAMFENIKRPDSTSFEHSEGFPIDVARSILEGIGTAIKAEGIENIEDSPRLFRVLDGIARIYPEGFQGEEGKALIALFLERGMLLPLRVIAGLTELVKTVALTEQEQFDALLAAKLDTICSEKDWEELHSGCLSFSKHIAEPAQKKLNEELGHYGLTLPDIKKAWDISPASGAASYNNISRNLEKMETLEQQRPGIVQSLFSEFGIKEFRRYPVDALIKQYDDRDKDEPYGVVLFTNTDHNQAFDMRAHVIESVFKQTGEHGIGTRIAEFDSRYDIMKRFAKLNDKYGEQHKISYLFFAAHGMEDSFEVNSAEEVSKKTFDNKGTARLKDFFVEHPEIIMASCSTGADNGIGQKISETFGATVHAPNEPTNVKSVDVTFDQDNKPHFAVTYSDDVLRRYDMGVKQ